MDSTALLHKLLDKNDITVDESKHFLGSVLRGEVAPAQIAAVLTALRMKGETTEEIVGFIQAMREQMVHVYGTDAIDVCGTGGDGSNSINVSTAVSLVVAASGVKVAKHGNRAASSKSGTADVLEALGVNINLTAKQAKEVLEKVGMVFLFAPNFHPATKYVVTVRKELKIRTIFNFLGPFLNPASTTKQLIGVPTIDAAKKLIAVGQQLGYEHLVIVTSEDGMDEVSISAPTHVFTLKNNIRKEFVINPKEFGFEGSKKEIAGGSAEENATFLKEILIGKKDAKRDIVILNSAVALVVAGKVSNIPDGIKLAEKAIDGGLAKKVLENLIKETNSFVSKQQKLHNILLEIVEKKKQEFVFSENNTFRDAIVSAKEVALIAEIKFASPTNPKLGSKEDLLKRVKAYEKAGPNAISIITEPHFFKGDVSFVAQVKKTTKLPVLQKDFVIDEQQIYQAKEIGSDALLLIARLVDTETLKQFVLLCQKLRVEPVVEINNEEDLEKAVATETQIIAVNARDLETFNVDVNRACDLMKQIPNKFIKLGFSGINSANEVSQYKDSGARGVLVGTSLMKAKNVSDFIKDLRVLPGEKVKVKICGVRTLEGAEAAIAAGADFLGFNFVPTSKRFINPKDAKKIIDVVRGRVNIVGIFQNENPDEVNRIAEKLDLDVIQLHGEEDEVYMKKITRKIIKKHTNDLHFKNGNVMYVLIDRVVQGQGEMVDLEKAKTISKKFETFFSGGLTPENVSHVIKTVQPFAVDVASGVETNGEQDLQKIKLFIANAKGEVV